MSNSVAASTWNALLSGAAVLMALSAMFIAATVFRLDVQYWNQVCGAAVRIYDSSYAAQLRDTGFSGKMPCLIEGFLALALPSVLTRSRGAHWASVALMFAMVSLTALTALTVSAQAYNDECYRGGHENAPGEVGLVILFLVAVFAFLNFFVLVGDWMTWLALSTERVVDRHRRR